MAHTRQFGVEVGVWAVWLQFLLCSKDSFLSGWMSYYLTGGHAAEKGTTRSGVDCMLVPAQGMLRSLM